MLVFIFSGDFLVSDLPRLPLLVLSLAIYFPILKKKKGVSFFRFGAGVGGERIL